MKKEFRVTVEAPNAAAEEFLNTMKKVAEKAEYEHGITVNVERVEQTDRDVDSAFGENEMGNGQNDIDLSCQDCGASELNTIPVWKNKQDYLDGEYPDYVGCEVCGIMNPVTTEDSE